MIVPRRKSLGALTFIMELRRFAVKVLISNQVLKSGKRGLNISVLVVVLSACLMGVLGGARASAQTAAQVAQIVKSYSEPLIH